MIFITFVLQEAHLKPKLLQILYSGVDTENCLIYFTLI